MKKTSIIIVSLLIFCFLLFACEKKESFLYHSNNVDIIKSIDNDRAQEITTALEETNVLNEDTKLVAADVVYISSQVYELYAQLMVRIILNENGFKIFTFETTYSSENAILLFDSLDNTTKKILSEDERNRLIFYQRRTLVHSTISITPSSGSITMDSSGEKYISLDIRNQTSTSISYFSVTFLPFIDSQAIENAADTTVMGHFTIPALSTKSFKANIKKTNSYNYYKIIGVMIYFSDTTAIKFDEFDCQFLNGDGVNSDILANDSKIIYHYQNENDDISTKEYYSGFGITLLQPSRYGYNFIGWFDNEDCQGNPYTTINVGYPLQMDLYAKWEEKPFILYHLCFGDEERKDYIENITYTALYEPYRLGYNFLGWYNNNEYSGEPITEFEKAKENVNLYAKWKAKNVYIIFDGNGNTSGEMSKQLLEIDEIKKLNKNTYCREGFFFVGWTTEINNNDIIVDEGFYSIEPTDSEAIKLYAKWGKNIETVDDLNCISTYNSGFYYLQNDIDLINYDTKQVETFYGIFNGNYHCLEHSNRGLFLSNYGEIYNLYLKNCKLAKKGSSGGGFLMTNEGIINNCAVVMTDKITEEISDGGFCVSNRGTINNSYCICNVTASSEFGGFVSCNNYGTINNCYVEGEIIITQSIKYIGGFVGEGMGGSINNCYSNLTIKRDIQYTNFQNGYLGGFIGVERTTTQFLNCFAIGDIEIADTNKVFIGGFAGYYISANDTMFRSSENVFVNGITSGVIIEKEKFYQTEFYQENNVLTKYIDNDYLSQNENAVWIIVNGELPKLYWERNISER